MGATIFTYTFPFSDPESQTLILNQAIHTVEGTWFSHSLGLGEPKEKFVRHSHSNNLELLIPVPFPELENSMLPCAFASYVALCAIERTRPSTDKEEITTRIWFIRSNVEEYQELAHSGNVGGLLMLSIEALKADSQNQPDITMSFRPHQNKLEGVSHFSEQSRRSVHKIEIMKRLGTAIGECLWEKYAQDLTSSIMPEAPEGFRLFRVHGNNSFSEFANSQLVGAYHHDCLIVCEELLYQVGGEAVPRYAVIPAATFSHSIYQGVGAARELGLDLLNAPGISAYMRMRPSLSAPMGECMKKALEEALVMAKAKFGERS